MDVTVSWKGVSRDDAHSPMAFSAKTDSGHVVEMDGAPQDGGALAGRNEGPRPMELVLAGTGGCTAYDVVLILRRGRHQVSGCDVHLHADRAETDPKVFTKINFHFVVRGTRLDWAVVDRAVKLSHEKYCSASVMLEKTATLTYTLEVQEDDVTTQIQ